MRRGQEVCFYLADARRRGLWISSYAVTTNELATAGETKPAPDISSSLDKSLAKEHHEH